MLRDAAGLHAAIAALTPLVAANGAAAGPATIALMLAQCALDRQESRGGHARTDFPHPAATAARSRITLAQSLARIALPAAA